MLAFRNRPRLLVITLMTGIVVTLVLGTTMAWTAMQRFHAIESQFQELSLQDFRLTRGLRSRTNKLHSAAMRFAVTQDPVY